MPASKLDPTVGPINGGIFDNKNTNKDPSAHESQLGLGLVSHFCSPQPDTSQRCEFPGSGLVHRWNVSVVAVAIQQSCSSFPQIRGEMARLSRPRATVCKLVSHTGSTQ